MDTNDDLFSPDGIDEQISQRQPAHDQPTPGDRLMHDLQQLVRSEQLLDSHSLEQVWKQVLAKRELSAISTQENRYKQHVLSETKRPEMKITKIKEKQTMEDNSGVGGMNSSASFAPTKKRRSFLRVVGIGLAAAVALLMVLSFTVFSGILRTTAPVTVKKPSTTTGAPTQQMTISHGKLVCSFDAGPEVEISNLPWTPAIAWSSQGAIAVTNYASVRAASAQNCASATFSQTSIQRTFRALWSPDGKKLVVGDVSNNSIYVLNNQGNIITHLSNANLGGSVWSADSTKFTFLASGPSQQLDLIKMVNFSNGNQITTLATFPYNTFVDQVSPDGKVALVYHANVTQINATQGSKSLSPEIWNVSTGKKISDLPADLGQYGLDAAFSPDGSQLAVSVAGAIKIYTSTGQLLSSIADTSTANEVHTIAWSPNGKYLAESANAIKIYDVNTQKLVTTFGTVDAQHQIVNLAWAPDNTGLAFTTIVLANGVPDDNMVNVWKLS